MEYYSAMKRTEILNSATTWMNLEDIILNEIIQSQKDKFCELSRGVKFRDRKDKGCCQELEGGGNGSCLMRMTHKVSVTNIRSSESMCSPACFFLLFHHLKNYKNFNKELYNESFTVLPT